MRAYFFFLLAALFSLSAHAESVPAVSKYKNTSSGYTGPNLWVDTPTLADCTTFSKWFAAQQGMAYRGPETISGGGDSYTCTVTYPWGGTFVVYYNRALTCPDSSWSLDGTSCTRPDCPSGQSRDSSGKCISACLPGDSGSANVFTGVYTRCSSATAGSGCLTSNVTRFPRTACNGTCVVQFSQADIGAATFYTATAGGTPTNPLPVFATVPGVKTGDTCTESDEKAPPYDNTIASCSSQGLCGGTINGKNVCSKCPDGTTAVSKDTKTTTTTNPDNTQSTTTTTTTTQCTDGNCSSTTTTSGSGGTSTTGTTESKDSFCVSHPADPQCKKADMPTDYNRETTQQQIKDQLKEMGDSLKGSNDFKDVDYGSETGKRDSIIDSVTDWVANFGNRDPSKGDKDKFVFTDILDLRMTGSCQPWTINVGGKSASIDPCPTAAKISELATYALYFLAFWAIFAIITKSPQGGNA